MYPNIPNKNMFPRDKYRSGFIYMYEQKNT